jgi:uncharacterized protein YbjT (DUF2867 family)
MSAPVIAVFGATGAQGGGLARAILADPRRRFRLRAVTRKPLSPAAKALAEAGAEIVVADLDHPASVQHAMEGAHGAFCVTNFWEHFLPEKELAQAHTMAESASLAGVRHVVWSTLEDTRDYVTPGSGHLPVLMGRYNVPHFDAKGEANRAFIDRRVPTTLLYTSFYWDNLSHFAQPRRGTDGGLSFVLPMDGARLPGIAAADIGPCAFAIFARGDELVGKSVGIAGEHLTGAQMADQLSLALGEPVVHDAMSPDAYRALGFPGADDLGNMFQFKRDFERSYTAARSVACSRELHPQLKTFAAWLALNKDRIPRG